MKNIHLILLIDFECYSNCNFDMFTQLTNITMSSESILNEHNMIQIVNWYFMGKWTIWIILCSFNIDSEDIIIFVSWVNISKLQL